MKLPILKKIGRGREYTFSTESEYLENVMTIDGGQWIELSREGNIFKIDHTPRGDKLKIVVKVNWFETGFSTIVA